MSETEIKECPFCGAKATLDKEWGPFHIAMKYRVECPTSEMYCCKPSTKWQNSAMEAIELWNRRK
jgi:hypothetical protein